jgi:hypothetical protein
MSQLNSNHPFRHFKRARLILSKYKSGYYVSSLSVPFGFERILKIHICGWNRNRLNEKDLIPCGIIG